MRVRAPPKMFDGFDMARWKLARDAEVAEVRESARKDISALLTRVETTDIADYLYATLERPWRGIGDGEKLTFHYRVRVD